MTEHKHIIDVNDQNFAVAISNGVKLVDFWAAWCMPCQMQTPILEKIGAEYSEKINILAINVDENPDTAFQNNITGIPALHLYKDGVLVQQFVGVQSPAVLRDAIDAQLAKIEEAV